MIIIGDEALRDSQSRNIQNICIEILTKANAFRKDWNGFNIMHNSSSIVGSYDLLNNYSSISHFEINNQCKTGEIKFLFLLGVDENLYQDYKDTFIVYQGHHGDAGAQRANVILPGSAYTEKSASFINLEGRLQKCLKASYPPGLSKEDWKIFNLVNKRLKNDFIFKNFRELRVDTLKKIKNHSDYDLLPKTNPKLIRIEDSEFFSEEIIIDSIDYYYSNAIARSSNTLSKCRMEKYILSKTWCKSNNLHVLRMIFFS